MSFPDLSVPGDRARAFLAHLEGDTGGPVAGPVAPSGREAPTGLRLTHNSKDELSAPNKQPKFYYCERSRFALAGPNPQGGTSVFHAPCKSNDCPYCGRGNMHRKQRRIEDRLQLDAELGNDAEIYYRFITGTLREGVLACSNEELQARVKRRLAKLVARQKKYGRLAKAKLARLEQVQEERASGLDAKRLRLWLLGAKRWESAAKGRSTLTYAAWIAGCRRDIAAYERQTAVIVLEHLRVISAIFDRRARHDLKYDRRRKWYRDKRRQLLREDEGLTHTQAARARAFRLIKTASTYGIRMTRRPRAFNPRYTRANWEGVQIESLGDVDIHPTGYRYPHLHQLHWTTGSKGRIAQMQPARRLRYLERLKFEQHYYVNNFLRNAVLELPLRWRIDAPYPYSGKESWSFVHGDEKAKSAARCVKYMAFHNGKIWRDGRQYPKRYRRFSATRRLLAPPPEKPKSEYLFIKRSLSQIAARLVTAGTITPGEAAVDGTVLSLTTPAALSSYRVQWALGLADGERDAPPARDKAAQAVVEAADADLAPLLDYWALGQGETWEEWQAGGVAASPVAAPGECRQQEEEEFAGNTGEEDPFGGPVYHPETWRVIEAFPDMAIEMASHFAAHSERAMALKISRTTKKGTR